MVELSENCGNLLVEVTFSGHFNNWPCVTFTQREQMVMMDLQLSHCLRLFLRLKPVLLRLSAN